MKVLVCGDRNWTDEETIRKELSRLPKGSAIIHGASRGADGIAGRVAIELRFGVMAFPADWQKFGKAAGPIRNRRMLIEGRPELVLAFHNDISRSKGTKDTVEQARALGIPVKVVRVFEMRNKQR